MPSTETVQLHIIDSAITKRVFQRRSWLHYNVQPHPAHTEHIIYFDTPQRDIYQHNHTLSLIISHKGVQQLCWHVLTQQQAPQLLTTYAIHERAWPSTILEWLATHDIPAHHVMPNAHIINKAYPRQITDHQHHVLVSATFTQGIISTNLHHETSDMVTLRPVASDRTQEIDAIFAHVYQHIPHRLDANHVWERIDQLLQHKDHSDSIDRDATITLHATMLMGTQRSADEALFVPLPFHDSHHNRRIVAALMRMHQHADTALEPFWLALDTTTQRDLTAMATRTIKPSYTALTPPINVKHIPFSEILRLRTRSRLRSLLEREAEVLNGFSAYDVHRIRVILRKMRALLECGDGIYEPEVLAQFRRGFRRMARFLGEIRDCDALRDHAVRILDSAQLPAPFEKGLTTIRQKALKNFKELLTDDKHQRFLHQFAEFVTLPNSGSIVSIQSVPLVLTERIERQRTLIAHVSAKSLIKMNDDDLHDLRIQIKHLRYLFESFGDLLLPAGDTALQRLITIQDHLGTIQDAAVAHQLLSAMRLHNTPDGKRIIQTLRQEAQQQRLDLPDLWTTCQDTTFNDSVTHALTALKSSI